MNAFAQARQGYASSTQQVKTPRAIEYEVIAQITHALKKTATRRHTHFGEYAEALYRNKQLWSTLAMNVADDANGLPKELRAQLYYLAEFTSRHTAQVLAGSASIGPLLEINSSILRGLRKEGVLE